MNNKPTVMKHQRATCIKAAAVHSPSGIAKKNMEET